MPDSPCHVNPISLTIAVAMLVAAPAASEPATAGSAAAAASPPAPAPAAPPTPAPAPASESPTAAPTQQASEPRFDHGAPRWYPPEAEPQKSDWVKLKSGEWLRGEIKVMRREKFEFDSDELDDLEFDWGDVSEFRSPRIHTFAFTGRRTATGVGRVDKKQVIVLTALGEQSFERGDLISIVSSGTNELQRWSGGASIGLTVRSGNTNQVDALLLADIKRRTAFSRLALDYRGNYSSVSGAKTVNNQKFDARIDRYLYKKVFITPATVEVYTDEFQNIEYRVSPGAGMGYEVTKRSWIEWTVGLDVLYRRTAFISVQQSGQPVQQDGALRFSTSWEIDITSRIDFDGNYSATVGVPDPGNTNQSATLKLSVDMISILDLDLSFVWDRVGQPQANSQGVLPQKDDFKMSMGLGVDF